MKQFTVVFPIAKVGETNYILLGEQKTGKPLAGFLNGYGGKVEPTDLPGLGDGETVLEAAERELQEELGIKLDNPKYIGKVEHKQKEIFFFISTAEFIQYEDSLEMINNNWYDLQSVDFVSLMLPGDIEIIEYLRKNIEAYFRNEKILEFKIEKTGQDIDTAAMELDKSIKLH